MSFIKVENGTEVEIHLNLQRDFKILETCKHSRADPDSSRHKYKQLM